MIKLYFFVVLLVFSSFGYAATNVVRPRMTSAQVEFQYAYGVSLAHEGKYEAAFIVIGQLIENGYHNPYAFQTVLSIGESLLQQRQFTLLTREKAVELVNYLADLGYTNYHTNQMFLYSYLDVKKNLGRWADFEMGLRQLLALDPENILGNFYRGFLFYNQRRFSEAQRFFRKVVNYPPARELNQQAVYRSYFLLGLIELQSDNYRRGIELLEQARTINDQDHNLSKYLAYGFQQILEFRRAHEIVKNIPEVFYDPEIALIRIQTSFVLGEPEWARLALAYEKDLSIARAYLLYEQRKYADVIKAIDALIEEYDVEPTQLFYVNYLRNQAAKAAGDNKVRRETLFLLGMYARSVGQPQLAAQYFLLLAEEPDLRLDALLTLGSLHEGMNNYLQAISFYEQFLREKTSDVSGEKVFTLNLSLAYLHYINSNYYRSTIHERQARQLARTPEQRYRLSFYTGIIALKNRRYQQSVGALQYAKNISNTAAVNYYMGSALFFLHRLPEAQVVLEESVRLEANHQSHNLLAYIYALRRVSLSNALVYIGLALEEEPDNIAYQDTLGWIYFQMGNYERALEVFAKIATRLDEIEPFEGIDEIYYHIGMVYRAVDRKEDARLIWQRGLTINPHNGYIKAKLSTL